ncbi:hypothetical protein Tco_1116685 [Tanacetum coccineum]
MGRLVIAQFHELTSKYRVHWMILPVAFSIRIEFSKTQKLGRESSRKVLSGVLAVFGSVLLEEDTDSHHQIAFFLSIARDSFGCKNARPAPPNLLE